MHNYRILWIDDELKEWEPLLRDQIKYINSLKLNERFGYQIDLTSVNTPDSFMQKLSDKGQYDLLLIDLGLVKQDPEPGLRLLHRLQLIADAPPRLILTAQPWNLKPRDAIKFGITEYYQKHLLLGGKRKDKNGREVGEKVELQEARQNFRAIFEGLLDLPSRYDYYTDDKHKRLELDRIDEQNLDEKTIIGNSLPMIKLKARLISAARSRVPILITGETGSGKELVAKEIHRLSSEESGTSSKWVAINCAAFTPELLMSELFGHKKGAFTGANEDHPGLLVEAENTTLFLDEIGFADPRFQRAILRALSPDPKIRPVGGKTGDEREIKIARLIAATDQHIFDPEVFQSSLLHRLAGTHIHVPPLREHADDLVTGEKDTPESLLGYLVQSAIRERSMSIKFTPSAVVKLQRYTWPGNVREHKYIIQTLVDEVAGMSGGTSGASIVDASRVHWHLEQSPWNVEQIPKVASVIPEIYLRDGTTYKAVEQRFLSHYVYQTFIENTGGKASNQSYEVVAKLLDCSVSTVKSRLTDYRRLFRDEKT